jgi:hypothetical protein
MFGKQGAYEYTDRGELLYETPPDGPWVRVSIILAHLLSFILFAFLNILFLLILAIISFIIFLIFSKLESMGNSASEDKERHVTFRSSWMGPRGKKMLISVTSSIRHIRVYENGISHPKGKLRAQLFPDAPGNFIPKEYLVAYEIDLKEQECIIFVLEEERNWENEELPHIIFHHKGEGVISSIGDALYSIDVRWISNLCPQCGHPVGQKAECEKCHVDRFLVQE